MQGLWKILAQSAIDENRQLRHILADMPDIDVLLKCDPLELSIAELCVSS